MIYACYYRQDKCDICFTQCLLYSLYILLFTTVTIMLFHVRLIESLQNEYKYLKIALILWLIMLSFQEDKVF